MGIGFSLASLALASQLSFSVGIGYDFKDTYMQDKYLNLDGGWRVHGLVFLDYQPTFLPDSVSLGYVHGSSLEDGLDGSPRDFDIGFIKLQLF